MAYDSLYQIISLNGRHSEEKNLKHLIKRVSNLRILRRVHPQPPVGLAEVVEDDPGAIVTPGAEDDARAGVGLAGDPGAVEGVGEQEEGHHGHEEPGDPFLLSQLAGVARLGPAVLTSSSSNLPVVLRLLLLLPEWSIQVRD